MKFFNLFSFSLFFSYFFKFSLKKGFSFLYFCCFSMFSFHFSLFFNKNNNYMGLCTELLYLFSELEKSSVVFFSYETHTCLVSIDRGSRKSLFNDNFHFSNSYFLCLVEFWFFYFFFQFIFFYEMVHTNQKKNLETQWAINHFIIILFIIYYYCPIT